MNAQLAKRIRNYSEYTGVPYRVLRSEWNRANKKERDEYLKEMKQLEDRQRMGILPKKKETPLIKTGIAIKPEGDSAQ